MSHLLTCPSCGERDLDLHDYDSLMVLRADTALFTLHCPHCATKVSSLHAIPRDMREEVRFAAIEVGARMGVE